MIIISNSCIVRGCPSRGQDHKWEWDRPTAQECLRIEEVLGIDIGEWADAFDGVAGTSTMKIKSLLMFVDLMHRRDGIAVPWEDIDVDFGNFKMIPDPDLSESAEPSAGKDPAPTAPSRRQKAAATASTSGRSAKAASQPKSSPTPTASGAGTG